MLTKTKGIVLHRIKYGETSVITHVYTEVFGRQSYLVRGVRSKNSKNRANLLQPLSLLDMEVYYREKRELQKLKEIVNRTPFVSIPYNMVKSSIALFLAEILYKTLKEEEPNPGLFEYLDNSIKLLDIKESKCVNFHFSFLIHLSNHLGFFPQLNFSEKNRYFDLQNGKFVSDTPLHPYFLSDKISALLYKFGNQSFENNELIKMDYQTHQELLENILIYYSLHISGMGKIKSYKILKEVFH